MLIRSLILTLAVGCLAVGCIGDDPSAEDSSGTVTEAVSQKFQCKNTIGLVNCVGIVANFPITVSIKNVRALNNNEINILSNNLNKVSILDQNEIDVNKVLNDVEVSVLSDFLNKFHITITKNDIDVCTVVAGVLVCK